jgi:DNA-binding CsgD family transcriptional regulator
MLRNEQFEILKLLCDGYSQLEVADKMAISLSNVRKQIASAKKETGALSTFSLIHKLSSDKFLANSFNRFLHYGIRTNNLMNNNKGKYIDRNYAYTA